MAPILTEFSDTTETPNGDLKNCWRYMSYMLKLVLVLGHASRFFRGQKATILGNIFNKILNWRLTIQREGRSVDEDGKRKNEC